MRNGNPSFLLRTRTIGSCPYPTYEEWKQTASFDIQKIKNRPYPTYEEWKHSTSAENSSCFSGPYPTYEEWKHCNTKYSFR